MRGVTFRRDNPVRTRFCLLTHLSGFCPDVYLGERPILGHSCPDLYPEYKRIVRGPTQALGPVQVRQSRACIVLGPCEIS